LEGASWDPVKGMLIDQQPGEMYYKMPVIWLETTKEKSKIKDENEEEEEENENENKINYFDCPMFKTTKRTGIISASGRSENYVISIVKNNF